MAASVYATPPPDLSGEDTALSDVSNSSQISSSSSQSKATKRNIAATLLGNQSRTNSYDSMQLDQSKKRRKQSTPIRLSALNLSTDVSTRSDECENDEKLPKLFAPGGLGHIETNSNPITDLRSNISPISSFQDISKANLKEQHGGGGDDDAEPGKMPDSMNTLQFKACEQCGEKFYSDIKLGVHILQHHSGTKMQHGHDEMKDDMDPMLTKIKLEPECGETSLNDNRPPTNIPRPDEWLAMPGLGFPFPPEAAAAALSASNYLSQLPLLSVPPVGTFPSVEGLSRPPLRIFNPEAYCDLCNKEFCNKYFLKTHKANKHGIYDPVGSSSDSPASNQMSQLTQVLQMQLQQQQQQLEQQQQQQYQQQHQQQQQQQQHQQQQQQQQTQQQQPQQQPQQPHQPQQQSPQPLMPPEPAVYCDICHKRFTNVFAMKRHRNKTHEIPPPNSPLQIKSEADSGSSLSEKDISTPLRLPEGFREDYSLEQEEVSFTPQPRKLSPSSSQQAREANFSVEKLKRLGVVNPEAFCDLCCKEYCNKYFLRTHKLKRHGILVSADDMKEDKIQWPFVQTTPLNLMIASEKLQRKPCDGESSKKIKQDIEEPPPPPLPPLKFNGSGQDENSKEDGNKSLDAPELSNSAMEGNNFGQDPEAISIDLQKLQSMILQLNDLNGQRPVCCNICGKELENQYLLHAHIATEHSGDNNNGAVKTSRCSTPTTSGNQIEICKQCDKEFPGLLELKQHIIEVHGLSLSSPVRDGFVTPERPINPSSNPPVTPNQGERRPPYTITPTSSYCEICNKELCNKYFMKTHMQRMHGIEIENGAQIGGVVCNICNKELCSKYFLRVHKHNTHGIVEEGSPLPQARQNGDPPESEPPMFPMDASKPDLSDLSSRYFTHYTEVCPLCSRRFRSPKWLRAHLMSDHGKAGTDKLREIEQHMNFNKPASPTLKIPNGGLALNNIDPTLLAKGTFSSLFMNEDSVNSPRFKEYQCSLCSFSTPYYAFLFIHERSHTFLTNQPPINKSETAVSIAKDQQRLAQPSTAAVSSSGTPTTTPASTPVPQTPQENANSTKRETCNSLNDLANLTNRPASYALPQNFDSELMQSFLIEECNYPGDNNETSSTINRFVPAVVFLPVRERISGPITVSFTLTPA